MTTLARRGSGTPATTGTTWASATNAVDGTAGTNPATYATLTSAVSAAVATIEVTGYSFSDTILASNTLNSVSVAVRHFENNTGRFASVTAQAFDGATAIGTASTVTLVTAATTFTFTPAATLTQLRSSTFKIRVTITGAASTQSRIFSLDQIDVTADYLAPVNVAGTIATNWGGWTATADGTAVTPPPSFDRLVESASVRLTEASFARLREDAVVAAPEWPGTIATTWGTWTATATATVDHKATVATSWATWSATAVAGLDHKATIATTWASWTATAIAKVEHKATVATTWTTWTATSVATVSVGVVERAATISTTWAVAATLDEVTGTADTQAWWPGSFMVYDQTGNNWPGTIYPAIGTTVTVSINGTPLGPYRRVASQSAPGDWQVGGSGGDLYFSPSDLNNVDHSALMVSLDQQIVTVGWAVGAGWTATAGGTVTTGVANIPATISTTWGTWTATSTATVNHPATIASSWATWTATATAGVEHKATVATTWSTWTATAVAGVARSATVATTWGPWTATALGTQQGQVPAAITTTWGTWAGTATATVTTPTVNGTISTSWGPWSATATAARAVPATVSTTWNSWTAAGIASIKHDAYITTTWPGWTGTGLGFITTPAPGGIVLNDAAMLYLGDAPVDDVYVGAIHVWPESGPVAPTSWLTVSYTPGSDRNDFDGEVGVRWGIGTANITFTWMGVRCLHTGDTGPRTLNLYEWFSGTKVKTATVDLTGKLAGQWAWVEVPSYTLLANGYYALLMVVTPGMQYWANPGATTLASAIVNIYDSYMVGHAGGLSTGTPNSQFQGVDVGWS